MKSSLTLRIQKQVLQLSGLKSKVYYVLCFPSSIKLISAQRLECFVIVGYPQKENDQCYNSLCCVDPQGKVIVTYKKTFLFETDENWAVEGPGFVSIKIDGLGKVKKKKKRKKNRNNIDRALFMQIKIGFGICMDINPYQFKSDFYKCEFANYHLEQNTDLIICCMAWLKSESDEKDLMRYWALRLLPLYNNLNDGKHTYFIACNRTGLERGKQFAGTSCALDISNKNVSILEYMNHHSTGVMLVEIL